MSGPTSPWSRRGDTAHRYLLSLWPRVSRAALDAKTMKQIIAERQLVGIKPNGEKQLITLRLGAPYQSSDVDWACPVEAVGLYQKLADIYGVDSFQALMLAIGLLRKLLGGFVEDGGKLFWNDEETEVNLAELFASGIGPVS